MIANKFVDTKLSATQQTPGQIEVKDFFCQRYIEFHIHKFIRKTNRAARSIRSMTPSFQTFFQQWLQKAQDMM